MRRRKGQGYPHHNRYPQSSIILLLVRGPSYKLAYIFDDICLGLQTGSRCSKYRRGNPTSKSEKFCKLLMSTYAGNFVGYSIDFINSNFYFLYEYYHFVSPANALAKSSYLIVHFHFDKGGTGNFQERTFCRFPADRSSFSPSSHRFTP